MLTSPDQELSTKRLRLKRWCDADRSNFAKLHADPDVMDDLGGPIDRNKADQKFDRYINAWEKYGFGKWAVYLDVSFLGYVGIMPVRNPHPLGSHDEIGWRIHKEYWGQGFATEAATASLQDVFSRMKLLTVLAYTNSKNIRSQKVIERLKFQRTPDKDFYHQEDAAGAWSALVWESRSIDWLIT